MINSIGDEMIHVGDKVIIIEPGYYFGKTGIVSKINLPNLVTLNIRNNPEFTWGTHLWVPFKYIRWIDGDYKEQL